MPESDGRVLNLISQVSNTSFIVTIVEESDGEDGTKVLYNGLPEELKEFLVNFNNDELLQNPKNVLRSIIRMQAMITGGMGGLIEAIDQDQSVMEFGQDDD